MAVDYGDARTGIAISDESGFLASPVCVIKETAFNAVVKKTAELAVSNNAKQIVVGLPKNMNGSLGERAEKSQKFAQALEKASGVPVVLRDERCTTMSAYVFMNATDTRGKKRKETVDAAAAMIILQDYLDYLKNKT